MTREKQQSKMTMDQKELQELVSFISLKFFDKPFLHQATFNRRLKTTGGRYHLNSHHLDFNPKVVEIYGKEELIKVIKHELCHYHLHLEGRGYQHKDVDFKQLLKKTGGSRYVQPLVERKTQSYHQYKCENCGTFVLRKRRINTSRYVCGKCHGHLVKIETEKLSS